MVLCRLVYTFGYQSLGGTFCLRVQDSTIYIVPYLLSPHCFKYELFHFLEYVQFQAARSQPTLKYCITANQLLVKCIM